MSRKKAFGVTRNQILDNAWDLIVQKGADISMKEIAIASDVSRQSVYLNFKSRGGLLMALVKRADERFTIKEDFFTAMATKSSAKRLDQCLCVWFDFAINIQPVASELIRLRTTDADAAAAWADRMQDLWNWEHQLVETLAADTALSNEWNVTDATDFLWSSSSIQIWQLLTSDRGWSPEKSSRILRKSIARVLLA